MSRILVLATRNSHKLAEIHAVLNDLDLQLRSPKDYPGCPEVEEDGDTLEANAIKKAREVCEFTGEWTLSDDSGLEVMALDGAPGVISARYAGEGCSFVDNNKKLLRELGSLESSRRTAHFRCVMALALPAAGDSPMRIACYEGQITGRILEDLRGTEGFGYDPVFYVPTEKCTLAEMTAQRKNEISHRSLALAKVRTALISGRLKGSGLES